MFGEGVDSQGKCVASKGYGRSVGSLALSSGMSTCPDHETMVAGLANCVSIMASSGSLIAEHLLS